VVCQRSHGGLLDWCWGSTIITDFFKYDEIFYYSIMGDSSKNIQDICMYIYDTYIDIHTYIHIHI
jgi:hypothetical protein